MLTTIVALALTYAHHADARDLCDDVVASPAFAAARLTHAVPDAHGVCTDVALAAARGRVDPLLAVAVAYHETRLRRGLVGPSGEVGPMQAQPRYHCPGGAAEGCPALRVSVAYLRDRVRRYGRFGGVGRYHGDPASHERARYAGEVLGRLERHRRWLRRRG